MDLTNNKPSDVRVSRDLAKSIINYMEGSAFSQVRAWRKQLIEQLARPADQQGEPVYQTCDGVGGWIDVDRLRYTACQLEPEEYECRTLYRHAQPATEKVLLPARKPQRITDDKAVGWNECIDAVAKLNGGKS